MRKYIAQAGYKYKPAYDDMTDKQFTLIASAYEGSEQSTFGNIKQDLQETYVLFLKSFTQSAFKTKLEGIINRANADGLCTTLENAVEVEKQEDGYLITMNFITRGD